MDPYDRSTLVHIQQSASFTKSQRRNGSKMWMDDSRRSIGGVCIFCFCLFFRKIFFTIYTFFLCRDFFSCVFNEIWRRFYVFVSHVNMIINQNKTKTYHKEISQKNTTYTYICTLVCTGIHVFVSVCGRRWIPQNASLSLSAKKIVLQKIFLKL